MTREQPRDVEDTIPAFSALKVVLALTIFGLGLVSVFAPRHLAGNPAFFSMGNMMASGVLLSAALVHQLAESAETLNVKGEFPWAMFTAGLTFMGFMVMEESIHLFWGDGENLHELMHKTTTISHYNDPPPHSHSHQHDHGQVKDAGDPISLPPPPPQHQHQHQYHQYPHSHHEETPISERRPLISEASVNSCCNRHSISCSTFAPKDLNHDDDLSLSARTTTTHPHAHRRRPSQIGDWLKSNRTHSEDPFMLSEHHHHDDHIELHLHGSILASGVLMLALSIHSILAGVSIGIEREPQQVASTAIAILAHKAFEGFCLGSSLSNAEMDHAPYMVLGVSFSCATPLGIVIGQLLGEWSSSRDGGQDQQQQQQQTRIATVQAIVAGTFLYIAIVEIGAKELLACRDEGDHGARHHKQIEAAKLCCFVFGFLAMSGVAVFV